MKVSPKQLDALAVGAEARFERQMLAQLRKVWPEQCEERGEEGVRRSIRAGLERARSYGFSRGNDVARYIHLMYAVTDDFDTHERVPPWVGRLLRPMPTTSGSATRRSRSSTTGASVAQEAIRVTRPGGQIRLQGGTEGADGSVVTALNAGGDPEFPAISAARFRHWFAEQEQEDGCYLVGGKRVRVASADDDPLLIPRLEGE